MKHLLIIALALTTFSLSAQDKERRDKRSFNTDFTPEQKATLQTKRMALALDLNESQQRIIQKLNLENVNARPAKRASSKKRRGENAEKPSSKERFEHQNKRLDKALAHKTEMKSILSKEQFEKWEKGMNRKNMNPKRLASRKMIMKRKRMMHSRRL